MTDYEPPGDEPWIVTLGVDPDGDLVLQAITENVDLDGVDALEHRFYCAEGEDGPVAVYGGVMVHTCDTDEDPGVFPGECDLFAPVGLELDTVDPIGRASLDDMPPDVKERIPTGLPFDLDLLEPDDIDEFDGDLLGPSDLGLAAAGTQPEDREPRGFQ